MPLPRTCRFLLVLSRGQHFSIELTYNYGVESYNIGDGFKGMGLRLPDLAGVVEKAKAEGGEIVSGPEARRNVVKSHPGQSNVFPVFISQSYRNMTMYCRHNIF